MRNFVHNNKYMRYEEVNDDGCHDGGSMCFGTE